MRIDKLFIAKFKNLINFTIDFDENQLTTILIGHNGTGKSNLLEALVLIFRDLDLNESPSFAYDIKYECRKHRVEISGDSDRKTRHTRVIVNGEALPFGKFLENKHEYLPSHVFAYYSGASSRLENHFDAHQNLFYRELLKGHELPLRPLFYARLIHSHFVLLAYFSFDTIAVHKLLTDYLQIDDLESVLFVFKQPEWKVSNEMKKVGDKRFWYARGIVQEFLSDLYELALAPIKTREKYTPAFNKKPNRRRTSISLHKRSGKIRKISEIIW